MEISEKDIEYLSYMERTDLFYRAMPKDITDEKKLIYGQLVQFGKKLYIVNYENWKRRGATPFGSPAGAMGIYFGEYAIEVDPLTVQRYTGVYAKNLNSARIPLFVGDYITQNIEGETCLFRIELDLFEGVFKAAAKVRLPLPRKEIEDVLIIGNYWDDHDKWERRLWTGAK